MDGHGGSSEYDELSNHRQIWKHESASIIEPPVNFIVLSRSEGKKRPSWALIDKAYMHCTWRSSQSSYHLFRTSGNISPSDHVTLLMDDLLNLSLHSCETVRLLAGKSLLKMMKRWPPIISNCVLTLTENLRNPKAPEYAILGSCAVLGTQTVLKRLTTDPKAFSSFLLGILSSSHHESLKAQKAITDLSVKYNIYFAGVSRIIYSSSNNSSDGKDFAVLVSEIGSMSFKSTNLHKRYNMMANRVLLLLAMTSRNDPNSASNFLTETAGHFLKNLKSQLPQTKIHAIFAINSCNMSHLSAQYVALAWLCGSLSFFASLGLMAVWNDKASKIPFELCLVIKGESYGAAVRQIPKLYVQLNSPQLERIATLDAHESKAKCLMQSFSELEQDELSPYLQQSSSNNLLEQLHMGK